MTTVTQQFEAGTPGNTVTNGDTQSLGDTAFQSLVLGTGSTFAYDTTHSAHGAKSAKVHSATSARSDAQWTAAVGSQTTFWARLYLWMDANPSAALFIFRALNGSTQNAGIVITTAGKVQTRNAANATLLTSSAAIALGQWVRIEVKVVIDSSAGVVEAKLFNSDPDAASATETLSSTAQNTGSTAVDTYRFGSNGPAAVVDLWLDDLAVSTTAYVGPALVGVSSADAATAADAGSVTAAVSSAETGTAADSGAVTAAVTATDTAVAADSGSVTASMSSDDTATATDAGSVTAAVSSADAGAATDTGSVTVAVTTVTPGQLTPGTASTTLTATTGEAQLGSAATPD